MFIHNFKYALKTLFRDKMLIFWTFAFPIILGTFFNMAFSDIEKNEMLDIIDIAVVNNNEFKDSVIFTEIFKNLSDKNNDKRIFNTKYVNEEEAKNLLEDDKISGYLIIENSPKVVVTTSGINETILKYTTEEVSQYEEIIKNLTNKIASEEISTNSEYLNNLDELNNKIYSRITKLINENNVNIKNISSNNLSYTMIEFYTLIAMTCLYGGILSMSALNCNLANQSKKGCRVQMSPTSKKIIVFSSVLASYLGLILLFIYTIFVLKVDYGNNLPMITLLSLVGSLAGLSLGIFISSVFKTSENTKTGIILAFTMFGCFLSGMMGITMKYIVDKNIPILNKINPANMITDGFYSLYYYDTLDRFYFNIISLLIFSALLISISINSLRRQKYDSI